MSRPPAGQPIWTRPEPGARKPRFSREQIAAAALAIADTEGRGAAAQDGPFGPNGLRHFEQSLAAVATAPLDTAAKLDLLASVDDYVFGHVMRAGEQQATAASTDPGHAAAITGYIQGQISTGQFPHLSKLARDPAAQTITDPGTLDHRFERGLSALLDSATAN